jgi:hypothetical protein
MDELLEEETRLIALLEGNRDSLIALEGKPSGKGHKGVRKEKKRIARQLDALEEEFCLLTQSWNELTIPEDLARMRSMKRLQFSALILHIRDGKRLMKEWDPTDRAYMEEHLRQSRFFNERFLGLMHAYASECL